MILKMKQNVIQKNLENKFTVDWTNNWNWVNTTIVKKVKVKHFTRLNEKDLSGKNVEYKLNASRQEEEKDF